LKKKLKNARIFKTIFLCKVASILFKAKQKEGNMETQKQYPPKIQEIVERAGDAKREKPNPIIVELEQTLSYAIKRRDYHGNAVKKISASMKAGMTHEDDESVFMRYQSLMKHHSEKYLEDVALCESLLTSIFNEFSPL